MIEPDEWAGCYDDNWKGVIVEDAFAHPAKFSRGLIRRIYEHARSEGWLPSGSIVVDPFGGVALGALDCMLAGCHWVGCELENKFALLGNANIGTWMARYMYTVPGFGTARIIQGDSRRLSEVLQQAGIVVSSPPFCDSLGTVGSRPEEKRTRPFLPDAKAVAAYLREARKAKGLSRKDVDSALGTVTLYSWYEGRPAGTEIPTPAHWVMLKDILDLDDRFDHGILTERLVPATGYLTTDKTGHAKMVEYGSTDGNLGNLPATEEGLRMAVGSPPYADSVNAQDHGIDWSKVGPSSKGRKRGPGTKHERTLRAQLNYGAAIGSPPFVDARQNTTPSVKGDVPTNHDPEAWTSTPGLAVGSPPYAASVHDGNGIDASKLTGNPAGKNSQAHAEGYGQTSGQLGAMKEGNHALVVGSPPYAESLASDDPDKRGGLFKDPKRRKDKTLTAEYGHTEGQLGAMISSPPYETGGHHKHQMDSWNKNEGGQPGYGRGYAAESKGQMANDFWPAARQIVEQTHLVLAPGAHAIWVLKGYVRRKKYVDFPDQWRQLCEAVGFRTLHIHHALLVKHHGEQGRLDGGVDIIETARKSFFRRIYESKHPETKIDFEVVLCQQRV